MFTCKSYFLYAPSLTPLIPLTLRHQMKQANFVNAQFSFEHLAPLETSSSLACAKKYFLMTDGFLVTQTKLTSPSLRLRRAQITPEP